MLEGIPTNHVKFISYDAPAYALCNGKLKLEIDGEIYEFYYEHYNSHDGKHFPEFWRSGGGFDSEYRPHRGEWIINVENIPEKFQKYALEIDLIFNANVPFGCCGGCA